MPRATGALPPLLLLLASACATIHPSHRDERFVILSSGDFTPQDVQRVRQQLDVGLKALERYIGAVPPSKFPIVVKLWSGSGVSHSYHGAGPIELFWVKEMRSPIIHELTHVLAGYTASNGHWTQEGFASYLQDQYGEDHAFPTAKHGLHSLKRALPHLIERVSDPTIAETDLSPLERAARDWRESVLSDLGGRANVSSTKLALLAATTGSWIILNSIDRYVFDLASSEGLASRKYRRAWPIVEQRMRIADTLRAQLVALGLDRVSAPPMDLNAYIAQKYGTNGTATDTEKETEP
jgi:hypothetical protein